MSRSTKTRKRSQSKAFANAEDECDALESSESEYNPMDEPPKKRQRRSKNDTKISRTTPKNARKNTKKSKNTSKKKQKKHQIPKLTQKSINEIKKTLNQHVKTEAYMVNRDWHDGYEEQAEELLEWYQSLQSGIDIIEKYCLNILNDDINNITYDIIKKCNQLLIIMKDTWNNMLAIPARCDMNETLTDSYNNEISLKLEKIDEKLVFSGDIDGLMSCLWKILLLTAASMGEEIINNNTLMRYIKDAFDNGVKNINDFSDLSTDDDSDNNDSNENDNDNKDDDINDENKNENNGNKSNVHNGEKIIEKQKENANQEKENNKKNENTNKLIKGTVIKHYPILKNGVLRLDDIFVNHKKEWCLLSNNVKVHRMRRAIDRRFDGPKHLRTRDFGDEDDCTIQ